MAENLLDIAKKALEGATPGPYIREAQGIYTAKDGRFVGHIGSHEHGIDWPTTEAIGDLFALAPDIARALIAYESRLIKDRDFCRVVGDHNGAIRHDEILAAFRASVEGNDGD
jgi:hypothetical protein